ncbi:hypothetical protein BDD43_1992 [Mucilaginibacter gracilis]|uniref:HEAT repeat protein n=1 Tax=Mucilaginibacter gracilis TaxID=423350 RepID=A0A495J0K1_9SPHI|nr:DUF6493 family protein [Mucilaginibacter gracilis]RKR81834.1 hypothetical protein BDD43_1992 [Mucilaginibacter gracilis]
MTVTEEFASIVAKEAEVIPFLKGLDKAQKKELGPSLKKLQKHYSEFVQQGTSSSYSSRGSQAQNLILSTAAFICFNQKDFEQSVSYGIINREKLTPILPWFCPDWFNTYVDKLSQQEFVPFDYNWYLDLIDQGYLQLNRQMVAKILPELIFVRKEKTWKFEYHPENLLKRESTLKEHLWYLFEFETNLHAAENYKQFEDNSAPGRWMNALKLYTNQGKISRERLLNESILCATKNFNQSASNWFMDFFMFLEPSKGELLHFQNELLNTFNSANSKPYNVVLKLFKDLVVDPEFAILPFLDHVPLVLTAESKTAVSSALMVLDKLAKKYPDQQEQICVIACQAFIHQDNNLQLRAAKLLQKYGDTNSETLKEALQAYYESLFSEARHILSDFSKEYISSDALIEDQLPEAATALVEIKLPENFDEFVFLASQSFDQNETYHFDLLPASILKFQDQMTAGNILKLMPAFQRAYKIITSDWASTMGYLDSMLAKFFTSYGQLLVSLNPVAAEPIRLMHQSFVKSEEEKKAKWNSYQIRLGSIKAWEIYTHSTGYKPHKHILLNAFFMLERNKSLPLLSTPTHEPCRVSTIALIERLSLYQKANVIPGDMDFQVAIARCFTIDQAEALKIANAKLHGEYRELVGVVFGEEQSPKDGSKLKSAWLVAGVVRNSGNLTKWASYTSLTDAYLTGDFAWNSLVENYISQQYDYNLRKNIDVHAKRKIIRIDFGDKQKKTSVFKTALIKILQIPAKKETDLSIYDYTELKFDYISAEHNDIKRLLYLNPNQPQILLAHIINKGLKYVDFSGENDKKLIIYALEVLLTLNYSNSSITDLFVASCMISSDKTVRTYAAESWIKGVTEGSMDSGALGRIIGKHEQIELAPLKRFTDLVIAHMFQISQKHNRALEILLECSIEQMSYVPINGCKKLLEIYAEVLSVNKNKVNNELVMKRFKAWEATEALKKIIQKLQTTES